MKIGFADFETMWGPSPSPVDFFVNMLKDEFEIEVNNENPDFLFCSWPGTNHERYSCPKIFYSGENRRPDFETYDWCLTHDLIDDPRHYRLPIYLLFGDAYELLKQKPPIDELWNRQFCRVMFGKHQPAEEGPREEFFRRLSEYKTVDSVGTRLNNCAGRVRVPIEHNVEFTRGYKFAMAFENHEAPGWTTEKIFFPMLANSIPIYWGNPEIGQEFNTKSFITCKGYGDIDNTIRQVAELDRDKEAYAKMMAEPWFVDNKVNKFVDRDNILAFFHKVFNR